MKNRIKASQIPKAKQILLKRQNYECALCSTNLKEVPTRNICLDHDHTEGHVRGVLCRNCNGIEGKIHNLSRRGARGRGASDFIQRILAYWELHSQETSERVYHPLHKTEDEKRRDRNAKARVARARKAAIKKVKE